MREPLLHRIALFARRRYRLVFLVAFLLVAVAVGLASTLELETDVLALLPRDEPVVDSFKEALSRFGSVDYLLVVVRVPEGAVLDPYTAYVDRIGETLSKMEAFDEVEYRLDDVETLIAEYLPTSLLFLGPEGVEQVAEAATDAALAARAAEMRRRISTPQSLALKNLLVLDPLGLAEIFLDRLTTGRSGMALDWSSGYLLSEDRQILLLLAKPELPPQDVDFSAAMVRDVEAKLDALESEWQEIAGPDPPPPPVVELGGRYVIALADNDLIKSDVIANLVTSMGGVLLLFLFAFRRFGPLAYAFVPLASGLALTFGFSAATYGVLSAATSGIAALLIGLGIDFVIVSYGRFVEERQAGASLERALLVMSGASGRAVVVGAVTSAATFYAFGVTDFTGLYQMGYLTGTGILLCMAAVLFLLPAMLAWSEDHHQRRRSQPKLFLHGFGSEHLIAACQRRPGTVLLVGLAVTVAAGISAARIEFVDSVQAMRPEGNRGVEIRTEVAERFGFGFDQMMLIVEADTEGRVLERAAEAYAGARRLVADGDLVGVDGISTLLPPPAGQRQVLDRLAELRAGPLDIERIRATFARELAASGLRSEPFERGLDLLAQALSRREPLSLAEVEDTSQGRRLIDRYLARTDEGFESVVYLFPGDGRWRREPPPATEALAASLGPGTTLTGANVVSRFLRVRVLEDAVMAAGLGYLLVAILLWFDYRRVGDTLLSLVPLTVGIVWMLGAMAALDVPMNFMNIFVTTMIIGIGVDYGVHMIHRYRELERRGETGDPTGLVETGKAIVLAALSTLVGFGSLSRSHYPGLASMGKVAILGAVATCLVAITLLPAWLALRSRRQAETERRAGRSRG